MDVISYPCPNPDIWNHQYTIIVSWLYMHLPKISNQLNATKYIAYLLAIIFSLISVTYLCLRMLLSKFINIRIYTHQYNVAPMECNIAHSTVVSWAGHKWELKLTTETLNSSPFWALKEKWGNWPYHYDHWTVIWRLPRLELFNGLYWLFH